MIMFIIAIIIIIIIRTPKHPVTREANSTWRSDFPQPWRPTSVRPEELRAGAQSSARCRAGKPRVEGSAGCASLWMDAKSASRST